MATYAIRFTVEGKSNFPMDMLRYDSCYPSDDGTINNIRRSFDVGEWGYSEDFVGPLTVVLTHVNGRKDWAPTAERWQSFGWRVIHRGTPISI